MLAKWEKICRVDGFLNSFSLDIDTVDVGVDVLAVGWGYLYEHERKKVLSLSVCSSLFDENEF